MMSNFRNLRKALKEGFKIRRQFGGTYSVLENGKSIKYVVTEYLGFKPYTIDYDDTLFGFYSRKEVCDDNSSETL